MALAPSLSVFRHRAYLQYWVMRVLQSGTRQMLAVAIGWQVYDLARQTRSIEESAFILGLVGLVQFLPVLLLSLIGGQAADRWDRKLILVVCAMGVASISGLLASTTLMATDAALLSVFLAAGLMGTISAFSPSASNSLFPRLVPTEYLRQAIAWNSLGFQGAAIAGPAVGGLLYVMGPQVVYLTCLAMSLTGGVLIGTTRTPKHEALQNARGLEMIIEGLQYIRNNKVLLGAISLDLVVVFFGGAVALLPVFARDILHVGSEGLGILRAAPALGAAMVAFMLAARPLTRHLGRTLLIAVAIYGLAMFGFALSKLFILSVFVLAVSGAADMISVYIRTSIVQLATPDRMRGRVSSVSFVFISASNELGDFESGVVARFIGPVGSVISGAVIAVAAALYWGRLFPELAQVDTLEALETEKN